MKREVFAFAVLSLLSFLSSSGSQAQVSPIWPPSYSGTGGSPAVGVQGRSPAFYPMRPWERYAQRGTRALKATPKPNSAPYTVPANFASAVDYSSGAYESTSVAVADVNGDGKPDLLVGSACATNSGNSACHTDGVISVLLGNGDGTFQTAVTYDSGAYYVPAIAVADVNGDGKPDLLLVSGCASYTVCTNGMVTVLLGNGDGTFQSPVAYNSGGQNADGIAVADVNGDGKPDLLVANSCAATCSRASLEASVGVLLGNGDGTFQTAVTYDSGGGAANSIAVADLRGNGKFDIAVVNCTADTVDPDCGAAYGAVSILLGNGDGTFQAAVPYGSDGVGSNSISIADLNGDGKLDLAVSNACGENADCLNGGTAVVLLGNGDGTFQTAANYDLGYVTEAIAVADVNGDGKPDLISASSCLVGGGGSCTTSLVGVLLGNGDETFQSAAFYSAGGEAISSVTVEDLNGDGKPDAVVVGCGVSGCSAGTGAAWVLINTTLKGPAAALSITSLNFANQAAGLTSPSQAVTLTSFGTVSLTLNSISITGTNVGDFGQTNNCGSSLAPGASCQINVTFTPSGAPSRAATLQLNDSAPNSPQTVALAGTVQDFSLATTSQASLTVAPGQVANYAIMISPVNGFSGQVALSCTGAPSLSTCNVTPGSVTVNSNGGPANIVITTAGVSATLVRPAGLPPAIGDRLATWLALPCTFGLILLSGGARRSPSRYRFCVLTALCLSFGLTLLACGGGGPRNTGGGTPPGSYNLTVTGTFTSGSTTLTNSTKLTLVVQ